MFARIHALVGSVGRFAGGEVGVQWRGGGGLSLLDKQSGTSVCHQGFALGDILRVATARQRARDRRCGEGALRRTPGHSSRCPDLSRRGANACDDPTRRCPDDPRPGATGRRCRLRARARASRCRRCAYRCRRDDPSRAGGRPVTRSRSRKTPAAPAVTAADRPDLSIGDRVRAAARELPPQWARESGGCRGRKALLRMSLSTWAVDSAV